MRGVRLVAVVVLVLGVACAEERRVGTVTRHEVAPVPTTPEPYECTAFHTDGRRGRIQVRAAIHAFAPVDGEWPPAGALETAREIAGRQVLTGWYRMAGAVMCGPNATAPIVDPTCELPGEHRVMGDVEIRTRILNLDPHFRLDTCREINALTR